jgi:hypothetical protein
MVDIVKFAETVQQMRDAQKEFFRTKATVALVKSKKIEKEVDEMVKTVIPPIASTQSTLL